MPKINLQDGEQARLTITREQEVEISKLYHEVYLKLKKQMDALPLQGEGTASQSLRKTYLNKLIKQLKAEYKSLGERLEKQIKKGMKDVSSSVVQANDDWLQKVGIKIEGAYSFVPGDIVALVSTGRLYGGGWTLSKAIWGESQKHAHDIDTIVASGIAANKSAYDIAKDLEKYVNPSARKEWDWSKVYPGTSKKVDYNAQRLARTMVSHAYQQSLLASTKYNPFVKGYRWRSAHSDRTCELCNDRDGQLYSANDLPLDHPNGMCTFIAELTGDLESIADRLGDWTQGKDDPELDKWVSSMVVKPHPGPLSNTEQITTEGVRWSNGLNEREIEAIRQYTLSSYSGVNSYLRGDLRFDTRDIREIAEQVHSALQKASTPTEIEVFRGTDIDGLVGMIPNFNHRSSWIEKGENLKSLIGTELESSSFLSTSLESPLSQYVSGVKYHILVPKGSQAASLESLSAQGRGEREFLIDKGARFILSGIKFKTDEEGYVEGLVEVYLNMK